MKLNPARMRQIPKFEITDLLGDFDEDHNGNILIVSNGKDSNGNPRYEDKVGRRVNQRGYLVSHEGQIINKKGFGVFRREEVDEDGEIPAPFCYLRSEHDDMKKYKDSTGTGQKAKRSGHKGLQLSQSDEFLAQVTKPMRARPKKDLVQSKSKTQDFNASLRLPYAKMKQIIPN